MMKRLLLPRVSSVCAIGAIPTLAHAHSFGTPYILPIPFWIYLYGCAATLVLTFSVLGLFWGDSTASTSVRTWDLNTGVRTRFVARSLLFLLRAGALACLLVTILAGFVSGDGQGTYIGMALFWVAFLLGFTYLAFVIGDLYKLINPWKVAIEWLQRFGADLSTARLNYPQRLGYWPAFLFYLALIWMELFTDVTPFALSILLTAYSAVTLLGVYLLGKEAWFSRVDFFSVFFCLIGKLAPVEYTKAPANENSAWKVRLRIPFAGVLNQRPAHISVVLIVLFMLSSTAYDGIYNTQLWTALYWKSLLGLLQPFLGDGLANAESLLMGGFLVYRKAGLLVFPFLYLGFYLLALLAARVLTRTSISLNTLALTFSYSLIPIALAYHFTHYYTFLLVEAGNLPWRIADPFALGWNLLGLEESPPTSALEMGVVWHTQVFVILLGHVVSVVLSHEVAKRTFTSRSQIMLSQIPLLVLMVAYTMIGLWILTLPLGGD